MSMIAASRTVARACLRTSSAAALSTATEGAALHKDAKLLVCDMAGTTVMEEGLVGLNTGYPTRLQEALLEKLELKSMVDAWCCAADVTRARPSPFMVFNLMNQCNVETGVVKVGDTVRDMGEGIAAHAVQNVGVLSGADDAATLFDAGADVVIPDVTKLSLEFLAEAPAAAAAA
ncbi:haloacid dehalogenase-like hydrolase [Aureococcus anophagefferens]|nr:haloacid dehalogenase-like hydrolase [Aureococcus anophagefferens]